MKTTKIILAHSGKQHSYLTALSLLELGFLERYYTSAYIKSLRLQNFINNHHINYLQKRFINGLNGEKVVSNWRFEVKEILMRKIYGKSRGVQNAVYQRDENFDNYLSKKIRQKDYDIFWGFQGSCLETLKTVNQSERCSIVELATAHVTEAKKILGEEQRLHPEWADSIDNLIFPAEYEKRLQEEPHTAKYVFAASEFTRQSLINDGVNPEKIKILPLCFNTTAIPPCQEFKNIENRPLKVLYCGTVTQRKGIKYLLDTFRKIPKSTAELHIIGGIQGSGKAFDTYKDVYTYHGAIPQNVLFERYQEFDILALPTVFEGFGLVIPEAMAAGLPVITTQNSFGYEIIKHRENGSIVPIRDTDALIKEILYYASLNNDSFNLLRMAAKNSANNYNRENFRQRIKDIICSI